MVRRLDLYDLLIRGDTKDDAKLLQGDVIFIPPVGATVGIDGEVRRPAIYELKGESTVAELLQLAGGLTAEADRTTVTLTRIEENQHRVVLLGRRGGLHARADAAQRRSACRSRTCARRWTRASWCRVTSTRRRRFAWHEGIRLTDVVRSVDQLRPNADIHYVLIRRESPPDRHVSVLSVDLGLALASPGTAADPELMPRDRITVFDLASGRDHVIQPVMDELRLQGNAQQPSQVVHVEGLVKVPGDYPLEPGMHISDLVRAGGGTADSAYGQSAELVRYEVVNGQSRRIQLLNIDLVAALHGDAGANIELQAFDSLTVKEVPEWREQETVVLRGEMRFPGTYTIRRGETLKSVINRAGGLTAVRVPRRQRLHPRRAQASRAAAAGPARRPHAARPGDTGVAVRGGQSGRCSDRDVRRSVAPWAAEERRRRSDVWSSTCRSLERSPTGSTYDVVLHDGDTLIVPRYQQQVTVIGEVQNATSHLYNPKLGRDDYIALSGGVTRRADRARIYIVRASGNVISSEGSSRWFDHGGSVPIKPGDTIVVPLDTEHIPALPLWTQVTQILYNVAIAVLAIQLALAGARAACEWPRA